MEKKNYITTQQLTLDEIMDANELAPQVNLSGKRFGRLVVTNRYKKALRQRKGTKDIYGIFWECQCDCGAMTWVCTYSLMNPKGGAQSCGCLRAEKGRLNLDKTESHKKYKETNK